MAPRSGNPKEAKERKEEWKRVLELLLEYGAKHDDTISTLSGPMSAVEVIIAVFMEFLLEANVRMLLSLGLSMGIH